MEETKVMRNKRLKKECLEDAAFELFINNSFDKTSIDQIVKKAGVAKGTFYLYFEDKTQLLNRVIMKKSGDLLQEALTQVHLKKMDDKVEQLILMVDCMLEYFQENQNILSVIRNYLCWESVIRDIKEGNKFSIIEELNDYLAFLKEKRGFSEVEAFQTIYLILEMVFSLAYDAIIKGKPYTVEQIKPVLHMHIRSMLGGNRNNE